MNGQYESDGSIPLEPLPPARPVTGFAPTGRVVANQVAHDKGCAGCGYNLRGLDINGVCPECSHPVELSLRGSLLRFAAREYVVSIDTGLRWILNAIIANIVLVFLSITATGLVASMNGAPGAEQASGLCVSLAGLGVSLASAYGYWKFTEPDPGESINEQPTSPRKVIRVAALVVAAGSLLNFVGEFVPAGAGPATGPGGAVTPSFNWLFLIVIGLLQLAAWVTQFFGMMLYVRWMARRVPDGYIQEKTRTYMWLMPLLWTVGLLLLLLGPLIALVLYWNLLNRLRRHTSQIRSGGMIAAV